MGISGLIGAGAQQSLDELIAQQLLQAQQMERERAAQAREAIDRDQNAIAREGMAQRGQIADREGTLRERELDMNDRARRDRANAAGVQDMYEQRALMDKDADRQTRDVALNNIRQRNPLAGDVASLGGRIGMEDVDPAAGLERLKAEQKIREDGQIRVGSTLEGIREANRPPDRTGGAAGMTPGQKFNSTRALRNDFMRETTAAREVQSQAAQMAQGIQAARQGNMAAGSQAVLVTFQKILDPTSVVRESEYARSASGQALLSRMQGAYEKLAKGGAGVPVQELEQFAQMANSILTARAQEAAASREQINAIAEEFGIDPGLVTRDIGGNAPTPGGTNAPPAPAGSKFKILGVK
jgi:hypothetical protein